MTAPFEASRIKIARAQKHIDELARSIRSFVEGYPYPLEMVVEPGKSPDTRVIRYRLAKEMPTDWPAVIGDAIHNLRTSLDLMAAEMVRMNGGDDAGVYFPFASSEAELEGMIRRRTLHLAAPEAVEFVRSLKPYTGGNLFLRGLHDPRHSGQA